VDVALFGELVVSAEALVATFLALSAGVFTPIFIVEKTTYRLMVLMALASGVMFWSFIDLMNDAALLGVNQGFSDGLSHVLVVMLFALTILLLFWLDGRFQTIRRREAQAVVLTYATAVLVAVGIGAHSLGEGVEIGSLIGYSFLTNPSSVNLISAIGGIGSGAAYVLHKFLEGFVIGVFATAAKPRLGRSLGLVLLAGVPTVIGLCVALVTPVDATVFFGIGAAAVIYFEFKLIPNIVRQRPTMAYIWALLLGFFLMYLAALFHSYTTIF
jgi:zinc transporter ZupT